MPPTRRQRVDEYYPRDLPEVDAVEIVSLHAVGSSRVSDYMENAVEAPRVRIEGESARVLAGLWRSLEPGRSARCHFPPVGFRFISDDTTVVAASVCWRCNNLYVLQGRAKRLFAFDAECESAQQLLSLARSAIGEEVVGEG